MYIRALSGDIDASGSFLGSLKGLDIAISLCDSEKHVIFLLFRDFDDVVVFSRAGHG